MSEEEPVSLDDAYALQSAEDSRKLYARWAATYESGFVHDNLYVIPNRVAEVFADVAGGLADPSFADNDRLVLDIGCGTGLAAAALAAGGGDWLIDGVDISAQMLAVAATKVRPDGRPLYRSLAEEDLTASGLADPSLVGRYAGALSSGTFTHGHLGPDALATVVRFGGSGCIFAIGINAEHFAAHDFATLIERMRSNREITDVESRIVEMYLPGSVHHGETAVVAVFRRA